MENDLLFSFFLIFTGAAVLSTFALFSRQPLLVAYILLGSLIGPYGLGWVNNAELLSKVSHIGIIFLLFLIGLDLRPRSLAKPFSKTLGVVIISSLIFFSCGFFTAHTIGFSFIENVVVGFSMMFSSTIIGIKLLPTTVLHHKTTGELVVATLLIQDLFAVLFIIFLEGGDSFSFNSRQTLSILVLLPALALFTFKCVKYLLLPLLSRFDHFHEYIFLLALGWCLGIAELASFLGLSAEIGAFIAGIALANSPISAFIVANLKPLRDFFLILFFFSLGAGFEWQLINNFLLPALGLAVVFLYLKPLVFYRLFKLSGIEINTSKELGFRLGQNSEFALLIAYFALQNQFISKEVSLFIQATTLFTFLISSYLIIFKFPTPIGISKNLRRD